jgi:pimeloyl-ACP methyl ester carboxylesterase
LKPETVVLVPGLWLPAWSLVRLARRLSREGFAVRRFAYPSVRSDLRRNAARLNAYLAALDAPVIHLVGHSLGGIVIRALFHYYPEQRPGRIVTIASPHQGSRVAVRLRRVRPMRALVGASIGDLLAGETAAWALPPREIGVIQGSLPVGLGRLFCRLARPHDGLLGHAEGALPGATDRIELPVSHTGALASRRVAAETGHFLRLGRFRVSARG